MPAKVEKLDLLELLKSMKPEDLAAEMETAKKEASAAVNHLRMLQSLEKLLKIETGQLVRKSPGRKTAVQADPPAANTPPAAATPAMPIKDRIVAYLRKHGTSALSVIAAAIDAEVSAVTESVAGDPDLFRKGAYNGRPGVALR